MSTNVQSANTSKNGGDGTGSTVVLETLRKIGTDLQRVVTSLDKSGAPVAVDRNASTGPDRASAFIAHFSAEPAGSLLVRNEGGYVARFTLTYNLAGNEFTQESGDITLGVNKSAWVPAGATEIRLKVEENMGWAWER